MEKRAYVDPDWTPDLDKEDNSKTASDKTEQIEQLDEQDPNKRFANTVQQLLNHRYKK
jgi:hypothetical protein